MSDALSNLIQWMVILTFFVIVTGCMFAEAGWISKKGCAGFAKAFVFSALSNTIGIGIGLFVDFVIIGVFMMFAFENPLKDSPYEDPFYIGLSILGVLIAPVVLLIFKRILLSILKIQTGKSAWIYSLVSSVLILVISLGITTLIGYVVFKLF